MDDSGSYESWKNAAFGNEIWAKHHVKDRKAKNNVCDDLCFVAPLFTLISVAEAYIRLEPFWSYKEVFDGFSVRRLGVARSILLTISIAIPLGFLLPAMFRKHRYLLTIHTVQLISVVTEIIQWLCKMDLAEIDDVINNLLGGLIGVIGY